MEYHQITLTEYMQWKQEIQERLNQSANNFVNIGYLLKKIRDTKAYEQDGYETLTEWAKATYNLTAPSVSRFIKINDEYSEDGYSRLLKREYEGYGYNQLYEMLAIPEADRTAITPATTVQEIREVKKFEKEFEKAAGQEQKPADGEFEQAVRTLMDGKIEVLEAGIEVADTMDEYMLNFIKEELIPSGTKNVRAGTMMVFLGENEIKVKKFAAGTETLTWQQFLQRAKSTMVEMLAKTVDNVNFDVENVEKNQPEIESVEVGNEQEESQQPEEKSQQCEAEREAQVDEERSEAPEETEEAAAEDESEFAMPEPVEPEQEPQKAEQEVEIVEAEVPEVEQEVPEALDEMEDACRDLLFYVKNRSWDSAMEQITWLTEQINKLKG